MFIRRAEKIGLVALTHEAMPMWGNVHLDLSQYIIISNTSRCVHLALSLVCVLQFVYVID